MDSTAWDKAKDVIADALKLPAPERDAFVRARCPDPALRAEIDALLRECDATGAFLEPHAGDPEPDPAADLPPGTRVGPYVIVDRLGRGGMGQVFLGSDPRLHRRVALKCLLTPAPGAPDVRARIMHEARAAARISHPHVATVHDVLEQDARAFIVMEYVEGESLAARLKRERLPIDRVVTIGRQLASALTAAHANGIVHRDLKPANVQITADGSVKVLDFGVAKAMAMLSSTTQSAGGSLDGRGLQFGTPGYMSPEQILGRDVDERTDIFSLGVILFELTTGRRPIAGTDPLDVVIRLAPRSLRAETDRAGVPRALSGVITRALEVSVKDRYQTASEMEGALLQVERDLNPSEPAPLPMPRRPWLRVAIVFAVAPLALLGIGYLTLGLMNLIFGRMPPFDAEPPLSVLVGGLRAVAASVPWITMMIIGWQAGKFAVRVISLWTPIGRAIARFRSRAGAMAAALGLNDPVVRAQALAMAGFVALGLVAWWFRDLISAFTGPISTSPQARLLPLRSDDLHDALRYSIVLDAILLAFAVGLARLLRLRARHRIHSNSGGVVLVGAILVLALLMNTFPYRIVWTAKREKIDYAGTRCYIIGDHDERWLVYCPDAAVPRNHVIAKSDPNVHRLDVVESIYKPADASAAVR